MHIQEMGLLWSLPQSVFSKPSSNWQGTGQKFALEKKCFIITCLSTYALWKCPVIPVSSFHRLPYAICSQFFAVLHVDLWCNKQNCMKIDQQSHSMYFLTSSEIVLTEDIFQKPCSHSRNLFWMCWKTSVSFSSVDLSESFSFVVFISLWCNQGYSFIYPNRHKNKCKKDKMDTFWKGQDWKCWKFHELSCSCIGIYAEHTETWLYSKQAFKCWIHQQCIVLGAISTKRSVNERTYGLTQEFFPFLLLLMNFEKHTSKKMSVFHSHATVIM